MCIIFLGFLTFVIFSLSKNWKKRWFSFLENITVLHRDNRHLIKQIRRVHKNNNFSMADFCSKICAGIFHLPFDLEMLSVWVVVPWKLQLRHTCLQMLGAWFIKLVSVQIPHAIKCLFMHSLHNEILLANGSDIIAWQLRENLGLNG